MSKSFSPAKSPTIGSLSSARRLLREARRAHRVVDRDPHPRGRRHRVPGQSVLEVETDCVARGLGGDTGEGGHAGNRGSWRPSPNPGP